MAVEIATAYVNIVPSAAGFGRALSRELSLDMAHAGEQAGDKASEGFGNSFLGGIGRIAAQAAIALGSAAVAAGGFGLKIAAENETAQIAFDTMLGSAEKAGAFLNDLKAFAAKTPFEFPELQRAASSLISAGVEAKKVIPIMTTLGNVTSGMGTGAEGVQRATIALQQMTAAGKITGEDLNQLRDAGIPVYDLLAAATGKSKEAVVELAKAGKLGKTELDQLMAALEEGKGMERFAGLMDKQSASLKGMVSTLKDTFSFGLAGAMEPAIPQIKGLLDNLNTQLEPVFKVISDLAVRVITPLATALNRLIGPIAKVGAVVADALGAAFEEILPALGDLLEAVVPLLEPIGDLVKALAGPLAKALAKIVRALIPLIKPLVRIITLLVEKLGIPVLLKIVDLIGFLADAFALVATAVGDILSAGLDEFVKWFERLTEDPGAALQELADWFAKLPEQIGKAIGDLGRWLWDHVYKPALAYVKEHLPEWLERAGKFFKELPEKIGAAIGSVGKWLWDNRIEPVITYFDEHIDGWMASIADFFKKLPEKIGQAIEVDKKLGNWLWDNIFEPAMKYLEEKGPEWSETVGGIAADVPDDIRRGIEVSKPLGQALWDEVFKPAADHIKTQAPYWLDEAANAFAKSPGRLVDKIKEAVNIATLVWDVVLLPAANELATKAPEWLAEWGPKFVLLAADIVEAMAKEFEKLPDRIKTAIGDLATFIFNEIYIPMLIDLAIKLPPLFEAVGRQAMHIYDGMAEVVANFNESVWRNLFEPFFTAIVTDAANMVKEQLNKVIGWANEVIDTLNHFNIFGRQNIPHITPFGLEAPTLRPKPKAEERVGGAGAVAGAAAGLIAPQPAAPVGGAVYGAARGGLNIEHLEVNGQPTPGETAFAIRSQLRWLSMTGGGM